MSSRSSLCSVDAATLSATNWEAIQERVAGTLGAQSSSWGETKSGGFNLVRFLRVDGHGEVVVRVPLDHVEDPETAVRNVVATMQYFHEKTTIPLPRIICYSISTDDAGRPYVVTTKAEGIALVEIWDDLSDDRRDVILHQVVQMLLEMYSHRFDKIGVLSREGDSGAWIIQPSPGSGPQGRVYTSGTDYWIDHATRRLAISGIYEYAHVWWMRSLIPALYDNSLDAGAGAGGFPLMHGDLHSQNIFILDAESDGPRISSIIDWDDTGTTCTSSFAQPPFFVVDHPAWDPADAHAQRMAKRNARDREAFARLLREEEQARFPGCPPRLSQAQERWRGVYLFEQCIDGGVTYSALWNTLVNHIVGDEDAHREYLFGLMENGVLKSVEEEMEQKAQEHKDPDSDGHESES